MDQRDLMREAHVIFERATLNLSRVLASAGIRLSPKVADKVRGVVSSAIAEGIALGERYAQWRRGHVADPFPEMHRDEDEVVTKRIRIKPPPLPK
jgi:hypothetical protein